jgi:hypothetical protein
MTDLREAAPAESLKVRKASHRAGDASLVKAREATVMQLGVLPSVDGWRAKG